MTQPVYLNRVAAVLPNAAVGNDQMEQVLGQVGCRPSRARAIVLKSNGILARHYALDPGSGRITHSNAQLTAEAIRALVRDDFSLKDIDLLACGTSSPDQLLPNHAVMVHGELGNPTCEAIATSGICVAGVMAMKYAFLSVAAGQSQRAVVTGSETASSALRSMNFSGEEGPSAEDIRRRPTLAFEKDFLRWMLSDGAAAALLQDRPNAHGLSLRIEWIDQFSYAHQYPVCMYAGGEKRLDGSLRGWHEFESAAELAAQSAMSLKQDVRLLDQGIRAAGRQGFIDMLARRNLAVDAVDWFLPHYSSDYFRQPMMDAMPDNWKIPFSRWFTNLSQVGNVGSASVFLMLEELLRMDALRVGQRLLCFVPESGRFSMAFAYLVVVDGP